MPYVLIYDEKEKEGGNFQTLYYNTSEKETFNTGIFLYAITAFSAYIFIKEKS